MALISKPPRLEGDEKMDISTLRSYLVRLSNEIQQMSDRMEQLENTIASMQKGGTST